MIDWNVQYLRKMWKTFWYQGADVSGVCSPLDIQAAFYFAPLTIKHAWRDFSYSNVNYLHRRCKSWIIGLYRVVLISSFRVPSDVKSWPHGDGKYWITSSSRSIRKPSTKRLSDVTSEVACYATMLESNCRLFFAFSVFSLWESKEPYFVKSNMSLRRAFCKNRKFLSNVHGKVNITCQTFHLWH